MKFPAIEGSLFFKLSIALVSAFVGWFTLLMGGAHLVEGLTNPNTNIPLGESVLGVIFCLGLVVIGLLSVWVMIGAGISIYRRFKQ